MSDRPFAPSWNSTQSVTNATSATAALVLPVGSQQVLLTNTSTTARVHVALTAFESSSDVPTGTAPTTSSGLPILPGGQVRVTVGPSNKLIRTIATAADGVLLVTPGNGD